MKTNLDGLFKTDKKIESDGVDFAISETCSFRIRRFSDGNPQVKKAMALYHKPYARQISMNTLSAEREREIYIKVFVNTCMVGWGGVEIDGGVKPYSKELAISLFKDLPDLFDALFTHASDFANYKIEEGDIDVDLEEAEDVGNS